MKPRWKILVELALGIVGTLWGSWMVTRGIQGELLFGVLPSWLFAACGVLVTVVGIERTRARWQEL